MKLHETGARILDLKLTFQCNNLCRFCVAGDKRRKYQDMPLEKAIRIVRDNAGRCNTVIFTGGEPTLYSDLAELVVLARQECGYDFVVVQTNGRRFAYRDYAENLVAKGANQFSISIHGPNAALHEELTQRPGSFMETLAGIRNLLDLDATVATNTVVTRTNQSHLPALATLLCSLGVRQMQFAFPHIVGKALANKDFVIPQMTSAAAHVCRALDIATRAGRLALCEGFPLCMLPGRESHAVENLHTRRKVIDEQGDIEDFHGHRMTRLKSKGPACPACRHFAPCEGPWSDYPETFGWKEFKPVP